MFSLNLQALGISKHVYEVTVNYINVKIILKSSDLRKAFNSWISNKLSQQRSIVSVKLVRRTAKLMLRRHQPVQMYLLK